MSRSPRWDNLEQVPMHLQAQVAAALAPRQKAIPVPVAPQFRIEVVPEPQKEEKPLKSKGKGKGRVAKTRNAGSLSEAAYWGYVRSSLRRAFRFWKPAVIALEKAQIPMAGPRGRKWGYVCAGCGKVYLRKQVQIDHKEPAGSLTDYAHVGDFLRRLTPEDPNAYQVLCTGEGTSGCHDAKTAREREARS